MKKYEAFVRGENFLLKPDGEAGKVDFTKRLSCFSWNGYPA
jgi:hypothetical protein